MPLRVNTNIPAFNSMRILGNTTRDLTLRIERLSSGLKVNRAADDAAGLSVSEGLRSEISGFLQGIRNSEQAINLIQTAEGALNEVNTVLIRMRELAVQSASSTVNNQNRESVNAEFVQLINEIDRIAQATTYNNTSLLTGFGNSVSSDVTVSTALASPTTGLTSTQISGAQTGRYLFADTAGDRSISLGNGTVTQTVAIGAALDTDGVGGVVASGSSVVANFDRLGIQLVLSGQNAAEGINPATDGYRDGDLNGLALEIESGTGGTFQVGPDDGSVHRIETTIRDMRASGAVLNLGSASVSSASASQSAILNIDIAIQEVVQTRGGLGSIQNRLGTNIRANEVMAENDQASDSTIRDADVALEVSALARSQILTHRPFRLRASQRPSGGRHLAPVTETPTLAAQGRAGLARSSNERSPTDGAFSVGA